jgi:hypothetical protein
LFYLLLSYYTSVCTICITISCQHTMYLTTPHPTKTSIHHHQKSNLNIHPNSSPVITAAIQSHIHSSARPNPKHRAGHPYLRGSSDSQSAPGMLEHAIASNIATGSLGLQIASISNHIMGDNNIYPDNVHHGSITIAQSLMGTKVGKMGDE